MHGCTMTHRMLFSLHCSHGNIHRVNETFNSAVSKKNERKRAVLDHNLAGSGACGGPASTAPYRDLPAEGAYGNWMLTPVMDYVLFVLSRSPRRRVWRSHAVQLPLRRGLSEKKTAQRVRHKPRAMVLALRGLSSEPPLARTPMSQRVACTAGSAPWGYHWQ